MENTEKDNHGNLSCPDCQRAATMPPTTSKPQLPEAHAKESSAAAPESHGTCTPTSDKVCVDLTGDDAGDHRPPPKSEVDAPGAATKPLEQVPNGKNDPRAMVENTESLVQRLESNLKTLKTQVELSQRDVQTHEETSRAYQRHLEAKEKTLRSETASLRDSQKKLTRAESRLETLQKNFNIVYHELREYKENYQRSQSQMHAQSESARSTEERLRCSIEFHKKTKDLVRGRAAQIDKLKAENDGIATQLESIEKENTGLRRALTNRNTTLAAKLLDLTESREEVHNLKKEGKSLNRKLATKVKQLDTKTQDLKASRKETKQLEKDHQKERSEYDAREEEAKKALNKALEELGEMHDLNQRHNFRMADGELRERWGGLESKIIQFVDHSTGAGASVTPPELDASWLSLCPNVADLLTNLLLRPCVFEAFIWRRLMDTIFAQGSHAWAGSLGGQLFDLSTAAEALLPVAPDPLVAELYKWRASSTNLLSRLVEHQFDPETPQSDILAMLDAMSGPFDLDQFDRESALASLATIFADARAFDSDRRKLRASITMPWGGARADGTFGRDGFFFDARFMKDKTPRFGHRAAVQNPVVALCVSPGLIRVGNNQGLNYDKEEVLAEMAVLCDMSAPASSGATTAYAKAKFAVKAEKDESNNVKSEVTVKTEEDEPSKPLGGDDGPGNRRTPDRAAASIAKRQTQEIQNQESSGKSPSGKNPDTDGGPNKRAKRDLHIDYDEDDGPGYRRTSGRVAAPTAKRQIHEIQAQAIQMQELSREFFGKNTNTDGRPNKKFKSNAHTDKDEDRDFMPAAGE